MGNPIDYAAPPEPSIEPRTSTFGRLYAGICALAVLCLYVFAIVDTDLRHGGVEAFDVARRGLLGLVVFGGIMTYRAVTGRPFRFRLFSRLKNLRW